MLGEAQWRWLSERLAEPADLRLVVTSVQLLATTGWESWRNFPREQRRFLAAVRDARDRGGGNGVVLLSGDRHVGGFYRLPADGVPAGDAQRARARGGASPGAGLEGVRGPGYPLWEVTSSSLTHSVGPNHLSRGCAAPLMRSNAAARAPEDDPDTGRACDEPDALRLGGLVRVNNLGLVEVDWEARTVALSLVRASPPRFVGGSESEFYGNRTWTPTIDRHVVDLAELGG
jgi:alkaline phosphatase D